MQNNLAISYSEEQSSTAAQSAPNKVSYIAAAMAARVSSQTLRQRGPWQAAAIKKVCEIVSLPDDWDGYGAPAIDRQVGMFALEVLQKLMGPDTPYPSIVPSSVGGVQMEWHKANIDLEIHITAPYEAESYFKDHRTGEVQDIELTDNVDQIANIMSRLSI